MGTALFFAVVFIGGPLMFLRGLRLALRIGHWRWVLLFAVAMTLLGFAAQWAVTAVGVSSGLAAALTIGGVLMFWLSWIAVIVVCAMRLNGALQNARAKRIMRALGAMATTLPWFGFAWASLMTG